MNKEQIQQQAKDAAVEMSSAMDEMKVAQEREAKMAVRLSKEAEAAKGTAEGDKKAKLSKEMNNDIKQIDQHLGKIQATMGLASSMGQMVSNMGGPVGFLQAKKVKMQKTVLSFVQVSQAPEDKLAKEMTHDLEMNFNKIAPFGKEDTAKELQDHAAKTQDTLVDAVENAEVAEIKRAVFRALTRLRAATIKEFDTIARLETQAIDAYNDAHHYRAENPLSHLHEDEAPVETDKLKSFHF